MTVAELIEKLKRLDPNKDIETADDTGVGYSYPIKSIELEEFGSESFYIIF